MFFFLSRNHTVCNIHFPDRLDPLTHSYNLDAHSPVSRSLGFVFLFSLSTNNSHKNPKTPQRTQIFFLFFLHFVFSKTVKPPLIYKYVQKQQSNHHKKNPIAHPPTNPLAGLPSAVPTSSPRRKNKKKRKILTPVGPPRSVRCPRLTLF